MNELLADPSILRERKCRKSGAETRDGTESSFVLIVLEQVWTMKGTKDAGMDTKPNISFPPKKNLLSIIIIRRNSSRAPSPALHNPSTFNYRLASSVV